MASFKLIFDLVIEKLPLGPVLRSFSAFLRNTYACHKLTTLPLEVILEIMKELDWLSLLNVRQSSNYLNELTRTLPVWRSQHRQYVADKIYPIRLEEPVESYSATDLEQWVLKRRSADIGWRCSDLKSTRIRTIEYPAPGGAFIIPGGRWLLVGDQKGSVLVYDLDVSPITKIVLIPQDPEEKLTGLIAIDVHSTPGENLTFNLTATPVFPNARCKVRVWRATLVGHGTQAHLTASCLGTFKDHPDAIVADVVIYANLLARSLLRSGLSLVEVFDWQKSTSSMLYKATIFPESNDAAPRLLPGNRLLMFSMNFLMIYALNIVEAAETVDPGSNITVPLLKLSFDVSRIPFLSISDGFSDMFATHFVVSTDSWIYGLTISHRSNETPCLSTLMACDSPRNSVFALTFSKAFIQDSSGAAMRLGYLWNREAGEMKPLPASLSSVISQEYPTIYHMSQPSLLDEETGRIIQVSKQIVIVDTAVYPN